MSADFWFQEQGGGPNPGLIGNSLRFRGSQYLTRTNVSNPTSTRTCTVSLWCKFPLTVGNNHTLVSGEYGLYTQLNIGGANGFYTALSVQTAQNASVAGRWQQQGENRDPSAWMHVVMVYNSVSGGSNGIRMYKNGVQLSAAQYIDPNGTDQFLTVANTKMQIGGFQNTYTFQGYMAEVRLVDGQALTPTDFGEYNDDGVWVPIDYTGTYGNSGYYLDFSDPANIGADRSGNGNNFTPTGFELSNTSSTSYDWMDDSPTKNRSTMSPLLATTKGNTSSSLREANLRSNSGMSIVTNGTVGASTGKRYFEARINSQAGGGMKVGVGRQFADQELGNDSNGWSIVVHNNPDNGKTNHNNSLSGSLTSFTNGDTINVAVDIDAGRMWFGKNGTWLGGGNPSTNTNPQFTNVSGDPWLFGAATTALGEMFYNFGNRPFTNTVPTGYEGWVTSELQDVPITNPSEHFRTILDTGANILTNAQATFPNGLWWIKDRANNNQHQLVDSVRGGNEALNCPNLNVQNYAAPAGNSVAWCWNLLADQSNGFHIGTYTGNGSADRVVAHGCNFTPEMVILKCREGNRNFLVYHTGMDANRNVILSDTNSQFQPSHGRIDTVDATNLNLVRGGNGSTDINANGTNYVYYAWRSVPGFSAFGSYRGNGNSDGPFIYTGGFRPAFIMIKSYSDAGEWQIVDTARSTFNPTQNTQTLEPSDPGGEGNFTSRYWNGDILSNGWKYRGTQQYNASGRDYIYIAFAEHPMGGGNVSPAPAR